jgi:hypothetical protein
MKRYQLPFTLLALLLLALGHIAQVVAIFPCALIERAAQAAEKLGTG